MPARLNFLKNAGTLNSNDHAILISHTADAILTTLTGVYPDRHGQPVANSYTRTSPTGSFSFPSSFEDWTETVEGSIPNMITPDGRNAPAPWVPYTRAGCDFGAVGTATLELENTGTEPGGDITKTFGNPSPQYSEAVRSNNAKFGTAESMVAQTDFVGIAIHCAQGSPRCAAGEADVLPDEPGRYNGFKALFGAQQVNPYLTGKAASVPLASLSGKPITDSFGQPGFPGFDGMEPDVALSYVAAMHEHGVQVTYTYVSDAPDCHGVDGSAQKAFGPGEAGYVQQLKADNRAFANLFARLDRDGINPSNSLRDHGGPRRPLRRRATEPGRLRRHQHSLRQQTDRRSGRQHRHLGRRAVPRPRTLFLGDTSPDQFTVHGDDAPPVRLANFGAGPLWSDRSHYRCLRARHGSDQHRQPAQRGDRPPARSDGRPGRDEGSPPVPDRRPARNATFVMFGELPHRLTLEHLQDPHR
jgi:hypothetical protein